MVEKVKMFQVCHMYVHIIFCLIWLSQYRTASHCSDKHVRCVTDKRAALSNEDLQPKDICSYRFTSKELAGHVHLLYILFNLYLTRTYTEIKSLFQEHPGQAGSNTIYKYSLPKTSFLLKLFHQVLFLQWHSPSSLYKHAANSHMTQCELFKSLPKAAADRIHN